MLAVCVVLVVLTHVLFAQLTLILAVVFYLITKVTRWRLSWLTIPAAAGLAWTAAAGPRAAAAGFAAGPARIADYLGASGHQADHLLHFTVAFTGIGTWLPRQLPLALVAGAAEAALAGWLTWLHTDEWNLPPARPGLIVAARRAAAVRAIRAGGVVTRDGSCLGVAAGSGARVTLSWTEAAGGVSVCGSAGPGRADDQLPADPRRGPAAQAGARRRPHVRSGVAGTTGRGLRRGRRAAAGLRR